MAIVKVGFLVFFLFFLAGCSNSNTSTESSILDTDPIVFSPETKVVREKLPEIILNTQLRDINSQKTFTLNDFKGKPVLLESFAVWCPVCTKQQEKIKELHEDIGDSVISISLDTDVNEDEAKVKEHLERNKFDWYYTISPSDLTKALIDQFGAAIVNAPQAPIILICSDQSARMLGRGVKSVSELKEAINLCG